MLLQNKFRFCCLTKLYIFALVLFSYISSAFATADVEEGWRYHASFALRLTLKREPANISENINLLHIHRAMAEELQPCASKDKYTCLFRFTPVIVDGDGIRLGFPIQLKDALFTHSFDMIPFIQSYEVGFLSGFREEKGDYATKYAKTLGLKLPDKTEKTGAFTLLPPFDKEAPVSSIALKLVQRNYVDPEFFEAKLHFRYPNNPTGTCFESGNYDPISASHQETKEKLNLRRTLIQHEFNELTKLSLTGDLGEALSPEKIKDLKHKSRNFHNNSKANSYSCAEQTALDFLHDERVIKYLQYFLNINNNSVKGILIDAHCSHTPCSVCATSIARESQSQGIFKIISKGKPVFVCCSCQNHYKRPESMLSYERTKFRTGGALSEDRKTLAGRMIQPIEIDIESTAWNTSPYPIILMKYVLSENMPALVDVDKERLAQMLN